MVWRFDKFIKEYGGVYDPYIGGENLETGIFFAARNNAGKPWPYAYKIILNGEEKLIQEKIPRTKAAACSCFEEWMMGRDAREVFNMKVE
ncbi:MAG: hypothetical protein QXT45_05320 [Candidatus Bilamarchaeaceae archaeon]